MNTKDAEGQTGLTRANIRFYEKEGLVNPERSANGYRDYSEADIETLKKIRLLRELGISLEDIRQLQTDEEELNAILTQRQERICGEGGALRQAQAVCREICGEQVGYRELDAGKYLARLGELREESGQPAQPGSPGRNASVCGRPGSAEAGDEPANREAETSVCSQPESAGFGGKPAAQNSPRPEGGGREDMRREQQPLFCACREDVIREPPHPWRRFLARKLDEQIYELLFLALICLGLHQNPLQMAGAGWMVLRIIGTVCLTLLLEPLQLSLFGTTISKRIMGIRVTEDGEKKLSYSVAAARTFSVLFYGEAFGVPALELWRLFRSWSACSGGERLAWETESELSFSDGSSRRKNSGAKSHTAGAVRRAVCYCAACAVYTAAFVLFLQASQLPPNRGMISAAQFAENYNYYKEFYQEEDGQALLPDGTWEDQNGADGVWYVQAGAASQPEITLEETGGALTKVTFSWSYSGSDFSDGGFSGLRLCFLSFVLAQSEVQPWNGELLRAALFLENQQEQRLACTEAGSLENPLIQSFTYSVGSVKITGTVENSGYISLNGMLYPADEETGGEYRVVMEMTRLS